MPLDKAALDYARLLSDPCNGPLVHPIYAGADAGFLFRAESINTVGTAPTDTCVVFHWTPGYLNSNDTDCLVATASAPGNLAGMTPQPYSPGKTFVNTNARGLRCIAACVKVSYPGTESARSGRLHFGGTHSGVLDSGATASVDIVAPMLNNHTRTPATDIELIWKPSDGDQLFTDPTASASAVIKDTRASLTVAAAGLPAGVGLVFHMTAVYEWTPATSLGVGQNPTGKARSRNTLDNVADFLIASGERFVRQAGSGMGSGLVQGIADTFGLMPARRRERFGPYLLA